MMSSIQRSVLQCIRSNGGSGGKRKGGLAAFTIILFLFSSPYASMSDSSLAEFINLPLDHFRVNISRTSSPPTIDGNLDDSCWTHSVAYADFTQASPNQEAAASESTFVYYAYDNENLYFAAKCFDSEPDKIVANLSRREDIGGDDLIQIMLDTYNDQRSCYAFGINPFGIQADETMTISGSDDSWDGIWTSAGKITGYGWQVEAAIPFKTLRYPPKEEQVWRVQVYRLIQRKGEIDSYVPMRKVDNNQLERTAELCGIRSIGGQRLFDVVPYVTSSYDEYPPDGDHYKADLGADIKYGLGSNLIVDATINPDYGHVEADIDYINLSPYELCRQEKRAFFIEKMDIFATPFTLFYSRRVSDPDVGIKSTGKVGKYGFGAFYARDNNNYTDHKDDYAIARFEREIMKQSHIGAMVTYVDGKDRYNTVFSSDWRIIKGSFSCTGQIAKSDTKGYDGLDWKGHAAFSFHRNNLRLTYGHSFYEKDFSADAGFVQPLYVDLQFVPSSYRTDQLAGSYDWYINKHSIQSISPTISSYIQRDYDGTTLVKYVAPSVAVFFEKNVGFALGPVFERRRWENSDFDINAYFLSAWANPSGYLGVSAYYQEGHSLDYWNARSVWQRQFSFDVTWNPLQKLEVIPSVFHASQYEYQHGRRTYNQWNGLLRLGYHFNKDVFIKVFLQGNGNEDDYTANLLFGYTFLPGSTFYLDYKSSYRYVDKEFDPEMRILFAKISLLLGV